MKTILDLFLGDREDEEEFPTFIWKETKEVLIEEEICAECGEYYEDCTCTACSDYDCNDWNEE